MKHTVYIALGGNLGDVLAAFRWALTELGQGSTKVTAVSRAYRTPAVMAESREPPEPDYWNAAVELQTAMSPRALLDVMHALEARAGRVRRGRWASRVLDLDVLVFDDLIMSSPELELPHPHLLERSFVLAPLAEIAPQLQVPGTGVDVATGLARLNVGADDILEVRNAWFGAASFVS